MRSCRLARRLSAAVVAFSIFFSGCANHPLVDDVTHYSTNDLVQKLKCEAQEAIVAHLADRQLISHQSNIFQQSRKLQAYELWRANNKSVLTAIDAGIATDTAELSALEKKQNELRSILQGQELDARALNKLLAYASSADETKKIKERLGALLTDASLNRATLDELVQRSDALTKARFNPAKDHNKKLKSAFGLTLKQYLQKISDNQTAHTIIQSADLDSEALRDLFLINNATLAMKLDFKITENDNGIASGSITWPIHLGSISLGYKAGESKGRVAQRVVDTTSLFIELTDLEKIDCRSYPIEAVDNRARRYPIVGNVGIGEFVDQYFKIIENTSLATATGKDTFTDTLTFTTKVEGQIKPSIEVKPINPSLIKAELDLNADRTDVHEVTLQIRPYTPPAKPSDKKSEKS